MNGIVVYMRYLSRAILIVLLACFLVATPSGAVNAQTSQSEQLQNEATRLQQQLQDIENQIAAYEQQLVGIRSEKNTLAKQISELKVKQAKLILQIKQIKLQIQHLNTQIGSTQHDIVLHTNRVMALSYNLSDVLREIYQHDRYSTFESLLIHDSLSDFYAELNNYQNINDNLSAILEQVQTEKSGLEVQKQHLSDQKQQQENFVSIVNIQQQQLTQNISNQNQLLQQTKGKEANYQLVLADTKKKAAEIRGRIYELFDVGKKVTFGEVVPIAQWVSKQIGVRPAFLLAILTQESNLGKNVGTCNRLGDPPSKSWRAVMKPDRDQAPFQAITAELALDIDTTPVSCPMRDSRGNQLGYGGAMGPAQFIPSTWMGYKDKVAAITGSPADPWNIRDAFIAAALKLKAGGAGTQSGEWAAAMRYFSGSTNLKYRFYGDNVVAIANQYQSDIEALNN